MKLILKWNGRMKEYNKKKKAGKLRRSLVQKEENFTFQRGTT